MSLEIKTHEQNGVAVVKCSGRIVFGEESIQLRDTVKAQIAKGHPIVIDLQNVSYVDSGGLGTLVGLFTSAQKAGIVLKLSALNHRVIDVLQITKLVTVFETFDNYDAAVASFRSSS